MGGDLIKVQHAFAMFKNFKGYLHTLSEMKDRLLDMFDRAGRDIDLKIKKAHAVKILWDDLAKLRGYVEEFQRSSARSWFRKVMIPTQLRPVWKKIQHHFLQIKPMFSNNEGEPMDAVHTAWEEFDKKMSEAFTRNPQPLKDACAML